MLNKKKSWVLTDRQLCDCEMIMDGSFSPLNHFMTEIDYESVLTKMRLSNGDLFPLPIVLDVDRKFSEKLNIDDAFNIVVNNGEKAGQTVFHLHLHLLAGKSFSEFFPG